MSQMTTAAFKIECFLSNTWRMYIKPSLLLRVLNVEVVNKILFEASCKSLNISFSDFVSLQIQRQRANKFHFIQHSNDKGFCVLVFCLSLFVFVYAQYRDRLDNVLLKFREDFIDYKSKSIRNLDETFFKVYSGPLLVWFNIQDLIQHNNDSW